MKHLAIFVADGFEDVELIAALDVFNRNGISYDLFSVEDKTTAKGNFEAYVKTEKMSDHSEDKYEGLFIPGGPGYATLLASDKLKNIIKSYKAKNLFLSAICAGPDVLLNAGAIGNDEKFTSHASVAQAKKNNTGSDVEIGENLVTGKGFRDTFALADAIVRHFKS